MLLSPVPTYDADYNRHKLAFKSLPGPGGVRDPATPTGSALNFHKTLSNTAQNRPSRVPQQVESAVTNAQSARGANSGFESRLPLRSDHSWAGGVPPAADAPEPPPHRAPDWPWFELDLHSVVGVISTDFGEDDL
jgi:hypothetical protein